jgi:hypothetical protein
MWIATIILRLKREKGGKLWTESKGKGNEGEYWAKGHEENKYNVKD